MAGRRSNSLLSMKALSPRQMATRVSGLFAFTLALMLLIMGRTHPGMVMQLRMAADDVLTPVISALSAPAHALRDANAWVHELVDLRTQNVRMSAQLHDAAQLQSQVAALSAENDALRALIRTVPESTKSYIAARIVGDTGGPYIRSALVSGGTADGIASGQAVVGPDGLVGRVVEAGRRSSRLLLITDVNSHIPVMGENSRERSIAAGNNTGILSLDYVPAASKLSVGERMITSGDGGIFPPGIAVGVVTEIHNGNVTVQPYTDWSRLEYVNVVAYDL